MNEEDFSPAQRRVLEVLRNGTESVLLTGVAGCGKSTILRHWLSTSQVDAMVLAPTGVAALNVGGSTIHRAFGFMPNMDPEDPRISLKTKSLMREVATIIIDEVSMVRADMLCAMDIVLRSVRKHVRGGDAPFGGVRMIMVGDFYQLPPVVQREEERWLEQHHGSRAGWAFYAPSFMQLKPRVFYLGESFRSRGDTRYTDLLNAVRTLDPNVVNALNEIAQPGLTAGDAIPRLCARKKDVHTRNAEGLRKLGVPSVVIEPMLSGDVSKIPRDAQEPIVLAEGARVMITRNGAGYVNGSLGTLRSFDATAETWDGKTVSAIQVELDTGAVVYVPRDEADVIGYEVDPKTGKPVKVVLASVGQYPLSLGYAWTIHKSQGQTLASACIDLGSGAFAHGQTYVALSRLQSAAGLYLAQPLSRSDLLLDPDVVDYFKQYVI
jgi:ATP-dependent exoDNAse (exonuclease V) alpha subunit